MLKVIQNDKSWRNLQKECVMPAQPADVPSIPLIPEDEREQLAPLSFTQQHMWLLAQLIPHMPVYNETVLVNLPGPLDVSLFERALNELIQRHALWRTSFPLVQGQPVQRIHPTWQVRLPMMDLRDVLACEREECVLQLVTQLAQAPFDLTTLPLVRTRLLRLDAEDYRLCLVMHHIIFDTHTLYQIFLPELHALYTALLHGQTSPLPPLAFTYANFAVWQQEQWQTQTSAVHLAYWQGRLAGAPALLELPVDRPMPSVPSYRGSRAFLALSPELSGSLKFLSLCKGVKLETLLIATLLVLLHRYTGQQDIIIGQTNRKNAPVEGPLGVFLTTQPLRVDLTGNPTFGELLARVDDMLREAQEHQDVPFSELLKTLEAKRGGREAGVQVLFSLEPAAPTLPSGWTITWPQITGHVATSDLFLVLREEAKSLTGWFGYNTDIFDAPTVQRICQHWETLLNGIV